MSETLPSVQAIRSVNRDSRAILNPPDPADVFYVDIHTDPETLKRIVLWDDIRLAFDDALHVRHQAKVVPFLKGKDFNLIKPFRIVANPDIVLDVVVSGPLAQQEAISPQPSVLQQIEQQAARLPKHNPFKTLRAPYSAPAPTNNFHRTFNNRQLVSSASKQPSNDAATQLRNKELALKRAKEIMAEIAARIDLNALRAKGDGPPEDFFKAMENYLRTVHKGHTHAQISVGDLFLEGRGVQKDSSVAMGWYLKAAYYGDTNAQRKIESLRLEMASRMAAAPDASLDNGGSDSLPVHKVVAPPPPTEKAHKAEVVRTTNNRQIDIPIATSAPEAHKVEVVRTTNNRKTDVPIVAPASEAHKVGVVRTTNNRKTDVPIAAPAPEASQSTSDNRTPTTQDYPVQQHPSNRIQPPASQEHADPVGNDLTIGDAKVQVALGDMYREGRGVEKDYRAAMVWYLNAAHQGVANAQCSVGFMYGSGLGVPQDYSQAMVWFRKAADQEHGRAQCNIGVLHEHGQGVPRDWSKAMEWYKMAAEQGYPDAAIYIEALAQKVSNGGQDQGQSIVSKSERPGPNGEQEKKKKQGFFKRLFN